MRHGRSTVAGVLAGTLVLAGCAGAPRPAEPLRSPYRTGPWSAEERALAREAERRMAAYDAQRQGALLASYAERGLVLTGRPSVLATEVLSVRSFQDDAAEIVLRRCVDRAQVHVSWRGLRAPTLPTAPEAEVAVVERHENRTWRIGPVRSTGEPC